MQRKGIKDAGCDGDDRELWQGVVTVSRYDPSSIGRHPTIALALRHEDRCYSVAGARRRARERRLP